MFGMWEAVYSYLSRMVGNRTDAADPAGSLHAKVSNIRSYLSPGVKPLFVIADNSVQLSADKECNFSSSGTGASIKIKEVIVYTKGFIRVSFDLRSSAYNVQGQIYRNGTAYGTLRTTTSTSYSTFTEDLWFEPGDHVQLYVATNNTSYSGYTRNFRLSFIPTTYEFGYTIQD